MKVKESSIFSSVELLTLAKTPTQPLPYIVMKGAAYCFSQQADTLELECLVS
jgi:hypothetical protein